MGNTNSQETDQRKGSMRRTSNLSIPKFASKKSSLSISSTRSSSSRWTASENGSIRPQGLLSRLKHSSSSFDDQSDLDLEYYSKRREEERVEMFEKFADNQIIIRKPRSFLENDNTPQDITSNLIDNTRTTTTLNKAPFNYTVERILSELYMLNDRSVERRRERDRRHRQHYLLKRIWGSNYKIPLTSPSVIVDWCCGTAVWGIELAFEFPTAKIIGIDYESATMSSLSNTIKNFCFSNAELHKGENGLADIQDNQVDYISMRGVSIINTPAIKWECLFNDVMRILKPGGFIEIYEQDTNYGPLGPSFTILEQWSDVVNQVIELDRNTCRELGAFLKQSGFANIQEQTIEIPVGEWSDTQVSKETGYFQKDIIERRFSDAKHWYCEINSIKAQEYQTTLIKAMDECDTFHTSVSHIYFSAQKPL